MTPRWTRAIPLAVVVFGLLAAQLLWTWAAKEESMPREVKIIVKEVKP